MTVDQDQREQQEELDVWMEHQSPYCVFCYRPAEPGTDYQRVTGWVAGRGRDGFVRDGYVDEFAHKHCIEINKRVGINQGAFDV